jgi:hypothetical protein
MSELEYATQLATWTWEKHYRDDSPDWRPLPDLMGVLTQIDNMLTGLVRARPSTNRSECLGPALRTVDPGATANLPPGISA